MRKTLFAAFITLACVQMQAQTNDSIQHRIDSLENTVRELKATIDSNEKEKKDKSVWGRKKFLTIGYVSQSLSPKYGNDLEGSFGVSLTSGRTIYLHKKPIWGKDFGEDYNNYYEDEDSPALLSGMHQCDLGALLGASATVNPVGDLRVSAYFRFVPTYSMLIIDEDISGSYVSFFTYGGEVTWKAIGIGIEGRSGSGKYGSIISNDESGEDIKEKFSTSSLRVYLSFRF